MVPPAGTTVNRIDVVLLGDEALVQRPLGRGRPGCDGPGLGGAGVSTPSTDQRRRPGTRTVGRMRGRGHAPRASSPGRPRAHQPLDSASSSDWTADPYSCCTTGVGEGRPLRVLDSSLLILITARGREGGGVLPRRWGRTEGRSPQRRTECVCVCVSQTPLMRN